MHDVLHKFTLTSTYDNSDICKACSELAATCQLRFFYTKASLFGSFVTILVATVGLFSQVIDSVVKRFQPSTVVADLYQWFSGHMNW